jgi:AraC-like DNA-binding protein
MTARHLVSPRQSPFVPPASDALAALRAHPKFPDAVRMTMHDLIEIYQGNRLLNQVMNDRGRVVFGVLALHLHFSDDGLTAARMKALCVETGLCSAGRAAAMLLLMRYAGYLTPDDTESGPRSQRLLPTARMIESQRQRVACHLRAMSLLMTEGSDGLACLHREDFVRALARTFGETFCAGYRILDSSPALYPLAERNAGMMILFSIYLAMDREISAATTQPVALSISALSRRFGVSRPHVLKLLRDAEAMGFLTRSEDSERMAILPAFPEAMQDFVASVFLFLGGCISRSLAEISATQPQD